MFKLKSYVLDYEHKHIEPVWVRGILCAPNILIMIRTLLTESGLEWSVFKYEFDQADDAQSTLEEFVGSILGLTLLTDLMCVPVT